MKLHKVRYSEFIKDPNNNPWELDGLVLGDLNLIVGKNATGKSRTVALINSLANIIAQRTDLLNGTWDVTFTEGASIFKYTLSIIDKKVIEEKIFIDDKPKLIRNGVAEIYSESDKKLNPIEPPDNRIVLHIRRDKKEYPFLEALANWATQTTGYDFGDVRKEDFVITKDITPMVRLNTVPQVIEQSRIEQIQTAISEFNSIGYHLENIQVNLLSGAPVEIRMMEIKEEEIKHFIKQLNLSRGMFRALALLIVINHVIDKKEISTILVDDLCEGMDYDRATRFTKLIYEKMKHANIQFIATSNDSFLMNAVPMEYWNILNRDGGKVYAYNYENRKAIFDEFKMTGLTNFDIFSSDFLAKLVSNEQ